MRRSKNKALENVSHYAIEPAAKKLEKTHPDVAARLWRAQGMRVVNAKKSKYYGAALSNFERAQRCFEMAGLTVSLAACPGGGACQAPSQDGVHGWARGDRRGRRTKQEAVVSGAREGAGGGRARAATRA